MLNREQIKLGMTYMALVKKELLCSETIPTNTAKWAPILDKKLNRADYLTTITTATVVGILFETQKRFYRSEYKNQK